MCGMPRWYLRSIPSSDRVRSVRHWNLRAALRHDRLSNMSARKLLDAEWRLCLQPLQHGQIRFLLCRVDLSRLQCRLLRIHRRSVDVPPLHCGQLLPSDNAALRGVRRGNLLHNTCSHLHRRLSAMCGGSLQRRVQSGLPGLRCWDLFYRQISKLQPLRRGAIHGERRQHRPRFMPLLQSRNLLGCIHSDRLFDMQCRGDIRRRLRRFRVPPLCSWHLLLLHPRVRVLRLRRRHFCNTARLRRRLKLRSM